MANTVQHTYEKTANAQISKQMKLFAPPTVRIYTMSCIRGNVRFTSLLAF